LFVSWYSRRPDLRSFPTRRSSDLCGGGAAPDVDARQLLAVQLLRSARFPAGLGDALPAAPPLRRPAVLGAAGASGAAGRGDADRSEEHTSELQSRENLVCRLLLEK